MSARTLVDVFEGARWQAEGGLFSEADLKKTAALAEADSTPDTSKLVESLLANARERLLDIPLLDVLLGGWLRLRALQAYATDEMRESEDTHEYELAKHKVSSKHAPKVELYVHDIKVADAELSLDLALVIARAKLLIRRGRIMEIAVSGCEAEASLKYGQHTLLKREAEELDFPLTLKLGDGVEIPPPLKVSELIAAPPGDPA